MYESANSSEREVCLTAARRQDERGHVAAQRAVLGDAVRRFAEIEDGPAPERGVIAFAKARKDEPRALRRRPQNAVPARAHPRRALASETFSERAYDGSLDQLSWQGR